MKLFNEGGARDGAEEGDRRQESRWRQEDQQEEVALQRRKRTVSAVRFRFYLAEDFLPRRTFPPQISTDSPGCKTRTVVCGHSACTFRANSSGFTSMTGKVP